MRVLVVDDKELMRDSVATTLARAGMQAAVAPDGAVAMKMIAEQRPAAVITDLQMPGMTGLELLAEIRRHDEQLPVVLMTAYATVQTAVQAMKTGAFDYITKPFEGDQLVATLRRAVEHARLLRENAVLQSKLESTRGRGSDKPTLVGQTPLMAQLRQQIERIAPTQGTVLISGESGSGKEVVAQLVHALSDRATGPLLTLNCAALSPSLLESELFGHEKGAFTGADRLRKGRFELADGGTLLLDEISEIPPQIQAKLLRVLQERAFERVGSSVTQRTDVRVIATTNRDLEESVNRGAFRQDLYFRLNVLPVRVPPLRTRRPDVALLADHFLGLVARREGRPQRRFDEPALQLLAAYDWPGNVRELYNICERASILSPGETIPADLVAPWLQMTMSAGAAAADPADPMDVICDVVVRQPLGNGLAPRTARIPADSAIPPIGGEQIAIPVFDRPLEDIERDVIVATLHRHKGHRQKTASELRIGVRTLGLKLRKWKELDLVAADL
ncbi:MAG: sigma-54-dependent Fis family transcriptional regulator [Phycisphaerales bacterium]|nr:sigma-54-dependent Fis family transcriptional regulator [Phycisphaerales bacterium]